MKSKKGSSFEREICKRLSLWWTQDLKGGPRDDVYWRSANSGGRATMRTKAGKRTHGHYGDIAAVDPIGAPLTSLVTMELKRGYPKTSFADALDKRRSSKPSQFEGFVEQAETAAKLSGSRFWVLITRRDQRIGMIFMPSEFQKYVAEKGSGFSGVAPFLKFNAWMKKENGEKQRTVIVGTTLDNFLEYVKPYHIHASMD